jgi:hypothetical protein
MNFGTASSHTPLSSSRGSPRNATLCDFYLRVLRPDGNGAERLQALRSAARESNLRGGTSALEQLLTQLMARPVRLSQEQAQAFKRLTETPALAALAPWSGQNQPGEVQEMLSASSLHDLYLALLKPDGGLVKRFKAVQAAAALYEPGIPNSRDALEQELARLLHRPVRLSDPQLRCLKELLVDEPAFAHIAPWEDLTASW